LVTGNAHVAKLADSGSYCVRDFVAGNESLDNSAGADDCFPSIRREKNRAALDSNFAHIFETKVVSVNVKSFQFRLLGTYYDLNLPRRYEATEKFQTCR
jgi:hypothetical protein